ncbi:unnamed protein product [Gongylonema pulchrum]|uniref:Uncharacterized protein n=1 Tax=Gongylonema pulchrum TaxID=637853 RepID=A0A183DRC9_9BILA|nr:unnamed protein product [Gongylonema pulchrum]
MSPASSTSSPSPFYRGIWRLTELKKKKHKKDSLTSCHSNSDEAGAAVAAAAAEGDSSQNRTQPVATAQIADEVLGSSQPSKGLVFILV